MSLRVRSSSRHFRSKPIVGALPAACPNPASNSARSDRSITSQSNRESYVLVPSVYVRLTQSSSGGNDIPSQRRVSASTPCARRASALLPASRSPFLATANSIGLPFQCVTTSPSLRVPTVFTGETHDTTYFDD